MDNDKTTIRRLLELILAATILACVVLVLVELATNVRTERSRSTSPREGGPGISRPGTGPG
jgi:hypothetical protein